MKKIFAFTFSLIILSSLLAKTFAQSEDNRTKIQMTITFGGKNIVADLNGVSTSLSRSYEDAPVVEAVKDTLKSKTPAYNPGALYLTIDAKKISDELLKVFARKKNRFDGLITIVDTYGKNPTRTIKFKNASLYSYSDQVSAGAYSESYGASAISISCPEVSINGITIEQ